MTKQIIATAFCALLIVGWGDELYARDGVTVIEGDLQDAEIGEPEYYENEHHPRRRKEQPRSVHKTRTEQTYIMVSPSQYQNQQYQVPDSYAGVQAQPTTTVEASPLTESRAAQLRKAREAAEVSTEQRIVEKLEQARLKDEERRAQRLFGGKFEDKGETEEKPHHQEQPMHQYPQHVQYVTPQPVHVVATPEMHAPEEDKETLKSEIVNTVKQDLQREKEAQKKKSAQPEKYYVAGQVGVAEYPDASNVDGNVSTGFSVGSRLDNRVIVEGTFIYSNFYIDRNYWFSSYPVYRELDQYNIAIATKYALLPGKISPIVGAVGSYTRRDYKQEKYRRFSSNRISNAKTDAFDVGFLVGMDVGLTDNLSIGADLTYFYNIANRSDAEYLSPNYRTSYSSPVEELEYYVFSVSGRISF